MTPLEKKRIAAVKTADAINAIEGAPISSYARSLSASWAYGELTGEQMKQALLAYHRRIAEQELMAASAGYVRDSFVMASLDQFSEFEHLERILLDAVCDEPLDYSVESLEEPVAIPEKYQKYQKEPYVPEPHYRREE